MASPLVAPPPLDQPPASPDVTAQQGPISEYLQNRQGISEQASSQQNAMALVTQKLNSIAADLRDVAQVLVTMKPGVMPILQRAVQALSMILNEVQSSMPQAQQGKAGVEKQAPELGGGPPGSPGAEAANPAAAS